jgi:hypothetical protein
MTAPLVFELQRENQSFLQEMFMSWTSSDAWAGLQTTSNEFSKPHLKAQITREIQNTRSSTT